VDRAIYDIAQRKLQLDAAIMEGVTLGASDGGAELVDEGAGEQGEGGSGKGGKKRSVGGDAASSGGGAAASSNAAATRHMGAILADLLKEQ
jgi:hypothetical protein